MKSLRSLSLIILLVLLNACRPAAEATPVADETSVRWQDLAWSWTALPGYAPNAYRAMQAVYDSARQRIVLFGGLSDQPLAETWEFDGTAWQQVHTTAVPPARFWHGLAYDPDRRLTFLFGGNVSDVHNDNLGDTWQYDGANWLHVTTAHSPSPRGRGVHLVYDNCRQKIVLFGGQNTSGLSSATWEFDGADWTEKVLPVTPPGRFLAGLAFDPQRCVAVLFGGGGMELGDFADTWEYDGERWTEIPTTHAPAGRWAQAMAYDPSTGTILLYGGYDPQTNGTKHDTWRYDGMDWEEVNTFPSPFPMEQASLAWDGVNGHILLIGSGAVWALEPTTGLAPTAGLNTPTTRPAVTNTLQTSTITETPRPSATATIPRTPHCDESFSRLQPGMTAILSLGGPPNRVRTEPRVDEGNIISLLYENTTVTILGGPVCRDGLVFWKIASSTIPGGEGWTAEGDGSVYYMEPYQP